MEIIKGNKIMKYNEKVIEELVEDNYKDNYSDLYEKLKNILRSDLGYRNYLNLEELLSDLSESKFFYDLINEYSNGILTIFSNTTYTTNIFNNLTGYIIFRINLSRWFLGR